MFGIFVLLFGTHPSLLLIPFRFVRLQYNMLFFLFVNIKQECTNYEILAYIVIYFATHIFQNAKLQSNSWENSSIG